MSSAAQRDRGGKSLDSAIASAKEALGAAPDHAGLEDASLKLEQGIEAARRKIKEFNLIPLPGGKMILISELAALEALGRENGIGVERLLPGILEVEGGRIVDLRLRSGKIASITAIAGLSALKILDLSYNAITTLQAMEGLTGLTDLYVSGNQLTTLRGIEQMRALKSLHASCNQLTTLRDLEGLSGLNDLGVIGNQLTTLEDIERLIELRDLDAIANPLNEEAEELLGRVRARGVNVHV